MIDYEKLTANILSCERMKYFPNDQVQQKDACFSHLFSTLLGILARVIRQEKDIKHPNWKGRNKNTV